MSKNGGDEPSSSKKTEMPSKPPRPPPPSNCSKLPRPASIQHHLDQLQALKPDRVRWFVKEDKKWAAFNGSDSLAIEHCYQQILALENRIEDSSKPLNTSSIYDMPAVKGGLYEVDVVARKCSPIYWKDKSLSVCRGTWFTGSSSLDLWQPLSEEDCEQIELSHKTMWRSMGLPVGPVENDRAPSQQPGLGRLKLTGFYVEWNDLTDVWLYWNDVKSRIIRNVGEKIGLSSGPATQLHRGYHTIASPDDRLPDISHLVFVVHGIGQLLHMSNIVKSCADIRHGAATVLDKQFPDGQLDQRVEFIPVEWRSSLKLDEGTIECITPTSVSGLRKVLNTSMMDIMYYTSPFYRYEIIDGVRDEMIQLYTKFCSRNPSFLEKNGKVSIVAHSLGSVIAYDILTLWDIELRHLSQDATGSTGFLTESLQYLRSVTSRTGHEKMEAEGTQKENLRIKLAEARSEVMRLEAMVVSEVEHGKHEAGKSSSECPLAMPFKVETLFCVGSPLAVFLALRGLRPQDDVEDHVLPKSVCKRLVNIYHPADPVAYRVEPLISGEYTNIPPVQLHRFDSKQSGYSETKPSKPGTGSKWAGLFSSASYRVGFSKHKADEEASDRSGSPNSEENMDEDDVVVVHNAASKDSRAVNDAHAEGRSSTDGSSSASSKRTGWIASLFGASKPSTSSNSSQESEEMSETDGGAKKDEQAKKEEHITVPAKVLKERLDYTLREGYMESNYWSAVTSHVSYWTSCDVARFILENCLDSTQNMDQS